jgi:hypothetical protein
MWGLNMRLDFAFLADSAMLSSDGKFSVLGGGLGTLTAQSFPALHPVLGLVARVIADQTDAGMTYPFRVDLIRPSGELLTTLAHGPVEVPNRPEGTPEEVNDLPLTLGIVITFPGITFPEPGRFVFRIVANEQPLGDVPLIVRSTSPSLSDNNTEQ